MWGGVESLVDLHLGAMKPDSVQVRFNVNKLESYYMPQIAGCLKQRALCALLF